MSDPRSAIQKKWVEPHRTTKFGEVITRMVVTGFRAHAGTVIPVGSPITAFCGPNGTGKTTLLYLAACAYQRGSQPYRLSDFFAVSSLDPAPFAANASVRFEFATATSGRNVTLSRRPTARWSDYRSRPQREVVFVGCGEYLPRAERRDPLFRHAGRFVVKATNAALDVVGRGVAEILGIPYEAVHDCDVQHSRTSTTLARATRSGVTYSELHMGYGERRVHALVRRLEAAPEKSLILLEEPEISLHQAAEYRLGKYLIELCNRRGHQVFLTTHSEYLLRSLPQASRMLLLRQAGQLLALPGLSASHAASLMSDGHESALTVLVEDEVARHILTEILRRHDATLLLATRMVVAGFKTDAGTIGGGADAMRQTMRVLRDAGVPVAAVLDGDQTADPALFIFALPGTLPPEKELFQCTGVEPLWRDTYGIDVSELRLQLASVDHHDWFDRLAKRTGQHPSFLMGESARAYATGLPGPAVSALVQQLREAANRNGAWQT